MDRKMTNKKMNAEVDSASKGSINIAQCIKDSFQILKNNPVLLISTSIIASLISGFTGSLLLGPMMMGMFVICDGLISNTNAKPEIGDLFKGFSYLVPGIILDIIGDSGLLICGFGIVITLPIATWAMMRIVDTGMSVGDALKDSIDFIFKKGNYTVILASLLASLLSCVGLILCCVGVVATVPLFYIILACAYRQAYPVSK